MTHLPRPTVLVVDPDVATAAALDRRFGADYAIVTATSADAALAALRDPEGQRSDVALVMAALDLPDIDGIDLLARVRELQPRAGRALLLSMDRRGTRIPFDHLAALQRATALGRIDFWAIKGAESPDELLYPHVQEALSGWTRANRPHHEVFRVVGDRWAPESHTLRDMLGRNTVPFGFHPADSDEGQRLIRDQAIDPARLPAIVLRDGTVLQQPSDNDIVAALGVRTQPAGGVYDLAILGAGPAGLTAAVYGASEGLRTLVIEPHAMGGQAGTSSMIRNYPGFPRGVSGGELAFRAWEQTLLFGAEWVFMYPAVGIARRDGHRVVTRADGGEVVARAVIVATGVDYRRLGTPALDRLVGAGVYYGAAGVEAPGMAGEDVYVVGGANSAGQAALHLARFARSVTLVVRGDSLKAGMSDYLIRQIASTPNMAVRLGTRVIGGRGERRLEGLVLETSDGQREERAAAGLFVMIGAEPRTDWLGGTVDRDEGGYVLTGLDVPAGSWPLARSPLPFETSLPGVFAVGDVRHGSVKRVAGAVGEGSVAVGSIHRYLAGTEECAQPRYANP
jgi:thioredoxin reductase (NADPH)